jgi:hypothetical protein
MYFVKKISGCLFRLYITSYLLVFPVLFFSLHNNQSDYENKLLSEITFESLSAQVYSNFILNQNLHAKQLRSQLELRIKFESSERQFADVYYYVLSKLYSKKHHYNFSSISNTTSSESFSSISRSPPLYLPYS